MIAFLNEHFFGPLLPILLIAAGVFLLFRCRCFLLKHPIRVIKGLLGDRGKRRDAFRAACVALSGTLGVGNIAGVAAAIAVGGAGAILWMWIFAFFAMVIKYVEVVTAMWYKQGDRGGAAYYIERGLGSKKLAAAFSVLLIFLSFGVGNIVQSSAAAEALRASFDVPKVATGAVFAVVTLLMIVGGLGRIAAFSGVVIPLLSLGYVILSLAILIKNRAMIPDALRSIVKEGLSLRALVGGGSGFTIGAAVRYGASRGILSNEAGCGTASYAHASSTNRPVEQGFWGIFEVFVDTVVLCTMTALVVLVAFPNGLPSTGGMAIAVEAYELAGGFGGAFIAVSSAIYALASVICWSYYGEEGLRYFGAQKKARRLYVFLYSAVGLGGAMFSPKFVWELSDFGISLMALCNTLILCRLSRIPKRLTEEYFSVRSDSRARKAKGRTAPREGS